MAGKSPMVSKAMLKRVGFVAVVSLGTVFALNTLANRFTLARNVQNRLGTGV